MTAELFTTSIDVIKEHQHPSGAYPASPTFPTYHYCWFRDGSFIAYAMDLVGEHESAARFHDWVADTILPRRGIVEGALQKLDVGTGLEEGDLLHTRYALDGTQGKEDWPNFQLDGFGTWLWALHKHSQMSEKDLKPTWQEAARLAARYIHALWDHPCYDSWEEFPRQIHSYTLASICAGLRTAPALGAGTYPETEQVITDYLLEKGTKDERFTKYIGSPRVDANLLGLSTPYRVVKPDHPLMVNTVQDIEDQLRSGEGVRRYPADSYYGGGEWILLTAWLGWYFTEVGETDKARELRGWIEKQADKEGMLPEQVPVNLNQPDKYKHWVDKWGNIAQPLLWSHAKYIILTRKIQDR